ncbi:MAG: phosphatase PAP2 family protein [Pedobacter sp.]|uniref:phosphatase PAP2 family protein n=1 Tax=Pedobacter sp. TaxID=1411316 RepID=UPI003397B221
MKVLSKNKSRILVNTLLIIAAGFVGLSCLIFFFPLSSIDLRISHFIQRHQNVRLDHFMYFVSLFGTMPYSAVTVAVASFGFLISGYKREALFSLLSALSGLVSALTKLLINRPRPAKDLVKIMEITREQSFPSGHTLFYTVFFGFMIIAMRNLKSVNQIVRIIVTSISAAMILLVPFSRIYLGAHWFTDVLGGAMLGVLCLSLLGYFYLPKTARLHDV